MMDRLAVLISGGLDSAILLGDALRKNATVYPLYIRCGLYWEAVEIKFLRRYLQALGRDCSRRLQPATAVGRGLKPAATIQSTIERALQPLTMLNQPVADLYGDHWSIAGKEVPDAHSADEAVFLPGRNVLLLTKALLWCHLNSVPALALGSLGSNPFPDASFSFFKALEKLVNQSVKGSVKLHLPFAGMKKKDVMRLGQGLPLELSFSCIQPRKGRHCGQCNKCAERQKAFKDVGMIDLTRYEMKRSEE